jgi:hypothetical protein
MYKLDGPFQLLLIYEACIWAKVRRSGNEEIGGNPLLTLLLYTYLPLSRKETVNLVCVWLCSATL